MRRLNGIIDSKDMNLSIPQETVKDTKAWHDAIHVVPKTWIWLSKMTTIYIFSIISFAFTEQKLLNLNMSSFISQTILFTPV